MRSGRRKHDLDVWVLCTGVPNGTYEETISYFRQNHENVEETVREGLKVFVKFEDSASAETFLTLPYVKCYGNIIHRTDVRSFMKGKSLTVQRNITYLLVGRCPLPLDKHTCKIELSGFPKQKFEGCHSQG